MRFRLNPTPEQEFALREHCSHARFVWNLAVDQQNYYVKGSATAKPPTSAARFRELTAARQEFDWLGAGSVIVQQQALRDYDTALRAFFDQPARGLPTFRKRGLSEGFRVVATDISHVRRLSRNFGEVKVPKIGWVRFRWSRQVSEFKSFRITLDRSGRWHIAFAIVPSQVEGPGDGSIVGVDRGVAVSAALSTGELLYVPGLSTSEARRLLLLQRKLSRCKRGSNRRSRVKLSIAKLKAREVDRRKDWTEKLSTRLATEFDTIALENLNIRGMSASGKSKRGLNRGILKNGWGLLEQRLGHKAGERLVFVPAAYTSQRCSACGFIVPNSRKSQAEFECGGCGFKCNADVNASLNIKTAGRVVSARAVSIGDLAELAREAQLPQCA